MPRAMEVDAIRSMLKKGDCVVYFSGDEALKAAGHSIICSISGM